jgi:ribosomal protein S18 acetylase RimI-like enzyme
MSLPVIRRAAPGDADAILPMATELYALEDLRFEPARARVALGKLLGDPSLGFAMVADDPGGGLAGYAICTFGFDLEFAGRDAFVTEVLVAEAWRGRGLGAAMLEAVEREAAGNDVHALHLLVRPDNPKALAVYHARGFVTNERLFLSKRLIGSLREA